ncbi:MAG: hypothetical protein AAFY82_01705 [Pseudomonadota bacterium]
MLVRFSFIVSISALSACATVATSPELSKQEMIASVEKLYELESSCGASGQELIDAPEATSFGVNASRIVSKSNRNADEREDELCADGGGVEFAPDIAGVRFLTSDVALLHGISSYREIAGDGSVLLDAAFNFTHVFQLIDDQWRIQHTHVAPLFPEE